MMNLITMGNDEFILYIRKQYPNCQLNTKDLGRFIWVWILEHDFNARQVEEDMPCIWETKPEQKISMKRSYQRLQHSLSLKEVYFWSCMGIWMS